MNYQDICDDIDVLAAEIQGLRAKLKQREAILSELISRKWELEKETIPVKKIPRGISGKSLRGKLLNAGIEDLDDFLTFAKTELKLKA